MYVAGVQSVGARSLGGVQAAVAEPKPVVGLATPEDATRLSAGAARTREAEVVVFPRRGPRLDQRPDDLKQRRAAGRYRESLGLVHDPRRAVTRRG